MDSYLFLKMLHILSAIVVMGTGAGIAFFMFMAHQSKNNQAILITTKHVVLADWIFTAPAVLVQFLTGLILMNKAGYSFASPWFFAVIGLFAFIGVCWLPVVRIQYQLKTLAQSSADHECVQPEFNRLMRTWTLLGLPAFSAILVVLWLMVFKPLSVV